MLYCNAEINCILCNWIQPSVLWRCWLGGRKSIRPVKNREWWGAGVVICLEWGADLHMAQLMPLPLVVCCFSKIQTGFNLLVPAHLGSPGKGPLNGCVCVCVNSVIIKLRIANIFGKIRQKSQFNMLPMTMCEQKREKNSSVNFMGNNPTSKSFRFWLPSSKIIFQQFGKSYKVISISHRQLQ